MATAPTCFPMAAATKASGWPTRFPWPGNSGVARWPPLRGRIPGRRAARPGNLHLLRRRPLRRPMGSRRLPGSGNPDVARGRHRYEGEYRDGNRHGSGTLHALRRWPVRRRMASQPFPRPGDSDVAQRRPLRGRIPRRRAARPRHLTHSPTGTATRANGRPAVSTAGACGPRQTATATEGGFRDGEQHGRGTYTFPDGGPLRRRMAGWQAARPRHLPIPRRRSLRRRMAGWARRHGHGTYVFSEGGRYEGEWRAGKRHGHGTYVFLRGWPVRRRMAGRQNPRPGDLFQQVR